MTAELSVIELEPEKPAEASVIWLHGLGADGNDFVPVIEALDLPDSPPIRFILPHAPVRPITLNGGQAMRGWYDIVGIGPEYPEDKEGIRSSQARLQSLIYKEQSRGISTDRILLAGFSQGGAIVLHTGLRYEKPLAGILALSTYLPLRDSLASELSHDQRHTPLMVMHGSNDAVVPPEFGRLSCGAMRQQGLDMTWKEYPMGHTLCAEQIKDIRGFILNCLQETNPDL
ncbi:MAG TPA: carboxylesterase [Gammaproteobacteria bacterium]|nr:carboxylesterase [Gammaproteobacteria bacterium]